LNRTHLSAGSALAVPLIVGSVFLMAMQDAIVKFVSADLPLWQLYTVRSLIAIPMLLAVAFVGGAGVRVRPARLGWAFARGGLLVAMYVAFYAAIPFLELSVVAAAYYTGPIFITLFAALLIGEPVGPRHGVAVVLGFAGVLLILRPGTDAFSFAMLIPIASAVFYALAAVTTRGKCAGESPMALSLTLNFAFILCGLGATGGLALWSPDAETVATNPFLLGPWVPVGPQVWTIVGGLALINVLIHLGLARAYQTGATPVIATFDYSYLIFAALWGFLLFREVPDAATVGGMALIAAAGLQLVLRPRRRWRRHPAAGD